MRNIYFILILGFLFSCGKERAKQIVVIQENTSIPPYDTIAIDSFSQGATSVDIARKIKMSSLKFQDSLKQIKLKTQEEQLLKKAKDEKLELEKKAAEAQKKIDAEKLKTKEKATTIQPVPAVNP